MLPVGYERRRHRWWRIRRVDSCPIVRVVIATALGLPCFLAMGSDPAVAAPPPSPLLWERRYVDEIPMTSQQVFEEAFEQCRQAATEGLRENTSAGPRIAVLGDSGENQNRNVALGDPKLHWIYDTHCGEKWGTALDQGRVGQVLAKEPLVLVLAMGNNDFNEEFLFRPDLVPAALANIQRVMDATDGVPCRVIVNMSHIPPITMPAEYHAAWRAASDQLNAAYDEAGRTRPGVHVADWARLLDQDWGRLSIDTIHLTRAGINARINLAIETARQCWPPDTPVGLGAAPSSGSATVWWDSLPVPEEVADYRVELSDGQTFTTTQNMLSVAGLTNGLAYQFRVTARNAAGQGEQSPWSPAFVPSGDGARFRAVRPVRVLDTRDGTGGKPMFFWPRESFRLDLSSVVPPGASAVALNVTATGQTEQTFVTVWPGNQPRPLASNLNPRTGVAAIPAMVTARLAPDRSVNLYNNSGLVHLVADVVGYYETPGATTGALYVPLAPTRILDTRAPGGPKATPFGTRESFTLPVDGVPTDASAVVVNVTSTGTTAPGFVTVWPSGQPRPLASNLNPHPGLTRANMTVARLGRDEQGAPSIDLFNNSASTDLVIDLVGYYTAEAAARGGSEYFPMTPERHYDTRDATGGVAGPASNASDLPLVFESRGSIPDAGVTAVDANVTVTDPSLSGHTTIWPSGARPTASSLNFERGETLANRNLMTLSGGSALAWSAAPSIQYVVDVGGWFGPTL